MNKAELKANSPVLLVSDVVFSANWYKDKLGFHFEKLYGDPPSFCILERDNCFLMLCNTKSKDEIKPNWKIVDKMWNVYFWTDNAEAAYKEFKQKGANIDYEIYVTPYNIKEFGVIDPDGYDIAFGEILR